MLLVDAIRAGGTETAVYRAPGGYSVVVKRIVGQLEHYNQEGYSVRLERPDGGPSTQEFAASDMIETLDRLRGLGLPDFDPEADIWQTVPTRDQQVGAQIIA